MSEATVNLHLVRGADGEVASFGERQAEWLVANGHAIKTGVALDAASDTGIARYRAPHRTAAELNALVLAVAELRECDFCGERSAPWRVDLRRPVTLDLAGLAGPVDRPVFACETCVELIRENRRAELVERVIETRVEQAIARGGAAGERVRILPRRRIRESLGPGLTDFVGGIFANRDGYPVRDAADD